MSATVCHELASLTPELAAVEPESLTRFTIEVGTFTLLARKGVKLTIAADWKRAVRIAIDQRDVALALLTGQSIEQTITASGQGAVSIAACGFCPFITFFPVVERSVSAVGQEGRGADALYATAS